MGGTNDYFTNVRSNVTIANLRSIYTLAKADGFKIVAFGICPVGGSYGLPADSTRLNVNNYLISDEGTYIDYLVRTDTLMTIFPYYYLDNLHPNIAGSQKIAQAVASKLGEFNDNLNKKSSSNFGYSYFNSTYSSNVGDLGLYGSNGKYLANSGFGGLMKVTTGEYLSNSGYLGLANTTSAIHNANSGSNGLFSNTTGNYNSNSGSNGQYNGTTGSSNATSGYSSLYTNKTGGFNAIVGSRAAYYGTMNWCTILGYQAGQGFTGKGLNQQRQIKIGNDAGSLDSLNNRLYIEPTNSQTPLIGGKFDVDQIAINKTITDTWRGTLNVGGITESTQYYVSSLNTAPSSATDTGLAGEIRICADGIYICIATNTWIRQIFTSW